MCSPPCQLAVDANRSDSGLPQRRASCREDSPGHPDLITFSGGGTRAAAFSYGVLEELRRTSVEVKGRPVRLVDEIDFIAGVSGGSFTALAFGLRGEKLFDDFDTRFLKRDVQGDLIKRFLNPLRWPRLASSGYGRSELAADYYDEVLFDGATFGDLVAKPGPLVLATATDISTGSRFRIRPV